MNRIIAILLISSAVVSCISHRYDVNKKRFKSNRHLQGLAISELKVDSINPKGIPINYEILENYQVSQKGNHKYDDTLQEYGYYFKPQKKIPFTAKSKYYSWTDSDFKRYDLLPIKFRANTWYLFTQLQSASTGGGKYNLFVLVKETGEFEKHFEIDSGSW